MILLQSFVRSLFQSQAAGRIKAVKGGEIFAVPVGLLIDYGYVGSGPSKNGLALGVDDVPKPGYELEFTTAAKGQI